MPTTSAVFVLVLVLPRQVAERDYNLPLIYYPSFLHDNLFPTFLGYHQYHRDNPSHASTTLALQPTKLNAAGYAAHRTSAPALATAGV